ALDRITNMVDAVGSSGFQYTSFGALLSEDGPWSSNLITYGYRTNHLLASLSLQQPNGSAWLQSVDYDLANRVRTITSPAGAFNYSYQLAGGLVNKITLPNNCFITNAFDVAGRLIGT